MQEQEILEGNKFIAEFMGCKPINGWDVISHKNFLKYNDVGSYIVPNSRILLSDAKWHSSWDWLMLVVEKIESLGFWVNIKKNHVSICRDNKGTTDSKMVHSEWGDQSKIQRVFICVVSFIKWYNYNENKTA